MRSFPARLVLTAWLALFFLPSLCLADSAPELRRYYDAARDRNIPVALFVPSGKLAAAGVVLFSHGYDSNRGQAYLDYSYLVHGLMDAGFLVASVQHEQPGDDPLPLEGNLLVARMPNWRRGVDNLRFVLDRIREEFPQVDASITILMGHSNGGDTAALFAALHPDLTGKLVTLDNRRYPLPRTQNIPVLTLRSSDYPADPGVLPESGEPHISVIFLPATRHGDMDDKGTEAQHEEILGHILKFLRNTE